MCIVSGESTLHAWCTKVIMVFATAQRHFAIHCRLRFMTADRNFETMDWILGLRHFISVAWSHMWQSVQVKKLQEEIWIEHRYLKQVLTFDTVSIFNYSPVTYVAICIYVVNVYEFSSVDMMCKGELAAAGHRVIGKKPWRNRGMLCRVCAPAGEMGVNSKKTL